MRLFSWYYLITCSLFLLAYCDAQGKDKETFQKIYKEVTKASEKYEIPKQVILSVVEIESSFNPAAVGKSHGEIGLMQLRPNFHKCAKFDIRQNIQCGVRYLRDIVDFDHAGNIRLETVARYNIGPNRKGIDYKHTRYWRKFKEAYRQQRWRKWLDADKRTITTKK